MPRKTVTLAPITPPTFPDLEPAPTIPASVYHDRIARAMERAGEQGLTHRIIFGDREHSASLLYFVDVDPRFEEAVLILSADSPPAMLLGNETFVYATRSPVELKRILFQSLSLMGQPRETCTDPVAALRQAGLTPTARPGRVGRRYFEVAGRPCYDLPHYLVDAVEQICGPERIASATRLLIDPQNGLRSFNEPEQIACFEWAATRASASVDRVVHGLTPGESEYAAMARAEFSGVPLSCHPMLTTGRGELLGLSSLTDKTIELGDRFSSAVGLRGGLSCRAGFVTESEADLLEDQKGYPEAVCFPYYASIALWYESLHCGASAGDTYEAVESVLHESGLGIALNPGHLTHWDEWTHTPFTKGSDCSIRSGMAIQCDNIPTVPTPFHGSNVEDGIVIADGPLRAALEKNFPEAWNRITARRLFMGEPLGIQLSEELLPLSNIPGMLRPFVLNKEQALVIG